MALAIGKMGRWCPPADDMGLGKPFRALAAIIERANDGPTPVIAPLSVTSNWISEAQRFSPTLNPVFLGATDREETIRKIGPFDLLVCSYGLLPYEIERLAQVKWQTIVLDEAQSIKNAATKRSQAAMQLNGEFKMITTGTLVENHLGELWNLFRFINPGLLGSLKKFNEKYAAPIEKFQDSEAKGRLKRLLQPFILRRLKNDVLSELPPETEITLTVNLSDEEQAFYRSVAPTRVENIMSNDNPVEDRRLDSRGNREIAAPVVIRDWWCRKPLGSAKLALFAETLDELLDNNHKALVFSQFVDHLTVIREYLDSKQIAYQYLDGSTPTRKRQEIVRNFQSGNGDVFLISLRAGGMGLNPTAADYVIHLDPWWNPAVKTVRRIAPTGSGNSVR
ncbi:MAG: DEAD/DEAH box helicase [Calditrichia bacterium]